MKFSQVLLIPLMLINFQICSYAQTWVPVGEDLIEEGYYTGGISAVGPDTAWVLFFNFDCDILLAKTIDGGDNWTVLPISDSIPEHCFFDIQAFDSNKVWLAGWDYNTGTRSLYKSVDGGVSWEIKHSFPGEPNIVGPVFKFSNQHTGYIISPWERKAFTTTTGGDSWTESSFEFTSGYGTPLATNWFDVKGNNAWFGTTNTLLKGIITDTNTTWQYTNSAFPDVNPIYSVAFNDDGTIGLACSDLDASYNYLTESVVQRSLDGGNSWTNLNPASIPLTSLTAVPGTDSIFVGASGIWNDWYPEDTQIWGSAYTLDAGNSWVTVDSLPLNSVVFTSFETGWGGKLGGYDYGINPLVFKWQPLFIDTDEALSINEDYTISPNPFQQGITIANSSHDILQIDLLDSTGKFVRNLEGQAHEYIPLNNLTNGVYFLKIRSDGHTQMKKIIKME
jgi:hypothetical protein